MAKERVLIVGNRRVGKTWRMQQLAKAAGAKIVTPAEARGPDAPTIAFDERRYYAPSFAVRRLSAPPDWPAREAPECGDELFAREYLCKWPEDK